MVNQPYPEMVPPDFGNSAVTSAKAPGSLYSPIHAQGNPISDAVAFRVNDLVIVQITESTSALNSATTDIEREHVNSIKVPSLFGIEKMNQGLFADGSDDGTVLGITTNKEHEGRGTTERSGIFRGSLAARVIHVLPNNYLVVQGYKNVQVNGENTRMYLTGIVNPLLIDRNHTVRSNQVADLQIRYGGEGVIAANQNPGLLSRILDFLWPF